MDCKSRNTVLDKSSKSEYLSKYGTVTVVNGYRKLQQSHSSEDRTDLEGRRKGRYQQIDSR